MQWWWRVATLAVSCLAGVGPTAGPVAAGGRGRGDDEATYLALGDSVAFGLNLVLPPQDRSNPANFVGYPEALARRLELDVTNMSCPGETSSGFVSFFGADNGCRLWRANFPLHV